MAELKWCIKTDYIIKVEQGRPIQKISLNVAYNTNFFGVNMKKMTMCIYQSIVNDSLGQSPISL